MRKKLVYYFKSADSAEDLINTLQDYKEKGNSTIDTIAFKFIEVDYVINRVKELNLEHYTLEEIYMTLMNEH